jgi:hypothetical protein
MNTQLITLENQTSPGTLTPQELADLVDALEWQLEQDYNTSPWVEHGYAPPAKIILLGKGDPLPDGAWNLILLDELPKEEGEGTLGFHEDSNGNIPYSDIGVKECRESGTPVSECASHEMLEMLVDPYVVGRAPRMVSYNGKDWIVEVADPVESCGYPAPNGLLLADFCWPRWFGLAQTRPEFSERGSVSAAFALAPQGYISTRPLLGGEEDWTQTFGDLRTELPGWASRLPRIHGSSTSSRRERVEGHVSDRQFHEIWQAISLLERQHMTQQDEIDALTSQVVQVAEDLATAKTTLQQEIDGIAAEHPAVDLSALQAAIAPLDTAAKALAALKPEATEPATPEKTVYLHTGEGAVSEAWTLSGFETVPAAAVPAVPANGETGEPETPEVPAKPAEPLYYFIGDTGPGTENGASGEWTPYTGAAQAEAKSAAE